ncbi:MAG: efflux RND transporter permease subunit [Gammaproteobacteria bacterium]|nr:efflux RND transporter permease subunit [Gammaproteobacteria bacterium]NNJ98143.1 efflux RND transporter permease subunit [Gammaproteobacteria bacterium]
MTDAANSLGLSGNVAKRFLTTEITPLLALVGFLLGVFAVALTPREEEPQINVTFANVFIAFPGASPAEVESLIAGPAEQVLAEIEGVEHVYSTSMPGLAVLTVQFVVGENRTDAIVRLYNKIYLNKDWLPPNLGVAQPVIKPKGIDDVPILTATLWSEDDTIGSYELGQIAHSIEAELKRVQGTRQIYTVGDTPRVVQVLLDPQAMSAYQLDIDRLRHALQAGNRVHQPLQVTTNNREILVKAGTFFSTADQVADLVVAVHQGQPVYLSDVATITDGPALPKQYVHFSHGVGSGTNAIAIERPAVTIAVAKQAGTNAVDIADRVTQRFEQLKGSHIPANINVSITRNYGATADSKAKKLINKLVFATASVVFLVLITLGWREAIIVGSAVIVTLAMTLFASWAWGFTLNRVSLFALIFSIGILVDDAIVVVENIHRHIALGARNLIEAIPRAVDEVGGPTILATFTVIAALLPMAFVSGLMGPYMSPIPINASLGMLISLAVAFVFTPWLTQKMLASHIGAGAHAEPPASSETRLLQLATRVFEPFLEGRRGLVNRRWLLAGILLLILLSCLLVVGRFVILKMLPFDNKSEFQVVLDMPEGSSLEQTARVLQDIGHYLSTVREVKDYQVYAGTAAPISFNGLVRQYYLREDDHLGDIQVNLVDKHERERQSHEIAASVRDQIQAIAAQHLAAVKIVEVPPGPPVMASLVAEIYGIDYDGQIRQAKSLRAVFENTADIVDIDDSIEVASDKNLVIVDRSRAALLGLTQQQVADALATVLDGEDMTYMHLDDARYAVPVRVEYAEDDKADIEQVLSLQLMSNKGTLVPLSEVVVLRIGSRDRSISHKDLLPVVYVTADMAGETDSPLYGMFGIAGQAEHATGMTQWLVNTPENPYEYSFKWDGEWQITYETFRDMGIAYSVGLLLIYLLVVAQFKSYIVPLVIMAPIPLTIIGILPGHAILDKQFTATSMIGMIALAGIIVRNSILLVDFINQELRRGVAFETAVMSSAAVRAKPIVLTGVAAMAGAFFILDDPIFSGLAVSLISGILVSTVLTLVVIPVVYYAVMQKRLDQIMQMD